MRHYSGRHWATDVSYRRSEHDIKTAGTDTSKSYRFQTWAVQLQYNIDASTASASTRAAVWATPR